MEIAPEQYERIEECLPVQRGNVRHENLVLLNAILYVAEHGCKWRGLPKRLLTGPSFWTATARYGPFEQTESFAFWKLHQPFTDVDGD